MLPSDQRRQVSQKQRKIENEGGNPVKQLKSMENNKLELMHLLNNTIMTLKTILNIY